MFVAKCDYCGKQQNCNGFSMVTATTPVATAPKGWIAEFMHNRFIHVCQKEQCKKQFAKRYGVNPKKQVTRTSLPEEMEDEVITGNVNARTEHIENGVAVPCPACGVVGLHFCVGKKVPQYKVRRGSLPPDVA